MIGATKCNAEDAILIRALSKAGMNHTQIAKMYVTKSGHKVSRTHIGHIIKGNKWNFEKHSFTMKNDHKVLEDLIQENVDLWTYIYQKGLYEDFKNR